MEIRDKKKRLVKQSVDICAHEGHSACAYCGKDMPKCWETSCAACGRKLCYDHAQATKDGWWICRPSVKLGLLSRLCLVDTGAACPGFVSKETAKIINDRIHSCQHFVNGKYVPNLTTQEGRVGL